MSILFLDDCPTRCAIFALREPIARIVHTAADCIAALKAQSWSEVHLDHDLGGTQMQDSDREDSGMEVVRFIEQADHDYTEFLVWAASHDDEADELGDDEIPDTVLVGKFIIHSWNHVAAPLMADRLKKLGYEVEQRPFRGLA